MGDSCTLDSRTSSTTAYAWPAAFAADWRCRKQASPCFRRMRLHAGPAPPVPVRVTSMASTSMTTPPRPPRRRRNSWHHDPALVPRSITASAQPDSSSFHGGVLPCIGLWRVPRRGLGDVWRIRGGPIRRAPFAEQRRNRRAQSCRCVCCSCSCSRHLCGLSPPPKPPGIGAFGAARSRLCARSFDGWCLDRCARDSAALRRLFAVLFARWSSRVTNLSQPCRRFSAIREPRSSCRASAWWSSVAHLHPCEHVVRHRSGSCLINSPLFMPTPHGPQCRPDQVGYRPSSHRVVC